MYNQKGNIMKKITLCTIIIGAAVLSGCNRERSVEQVEQEKVSQQQEQYLIGQPVPVFDWSLERHFVTQLYSIRNQKVSTHSVWRSHTGMIEGDCPSMGFGLPYDTSLTNPQQIARVYKKNRDIGLTAWGGVVGQAEPNGIFQSQNTSATWVLCLGVTGTLEPVYVETKVTVYPGPVKVDYKTNRVTRSGAATVLINDE